MHIDTIYADICQPAKLSSARKPRNYLQVGFQLNCHNPSKAGCNKAKCTNLCTTWPERIKKEANHLK